MHKKTSRNREVVNNFISNYILAVFALSLQHSLEPLAHDLPQLFFLPLPPSAKVTPDTNNATVANTSTFFIYIFLM